MISLPFSVIGGRHSQGENEKRKIISVAADQVTITLDSPLNFTHLGVSETMPGIILFC